MARDDYPVIVYQILAYLYNCLKKGNDPDKRMLEVGSPLFTDINKKYWTYIIYNMYQLGFIDGISLVEVDGYDLPMIADLEHAFITPTGIEYLTDNSFMEKAKRFLKDVKEIVPFAK